MAAVQAKLDEAQAEFDKAMRQKQALEEDAAATQKKMDSASALIGALAGAPPPRPYACIGRAARRAAGWRGWHGSGNPCLKALCAFARALAHVHWQTSRLAKRLSHEAALTASSQGELRAERCACTHLLKLRCAVCRRGDALERAEQRV